MNHAQKVALHYILTSLRDEPQAWKIGEYEAECRDMTVWIANGCYGIDFSIGKVKFQSDCFPLWFLNPFGWWRFELLDAVRKVEAAQMLASLEQRRV